VRAGVAPSAPPLRLHGGGGFRRRLAVAFGRDEAARDALWRRLVHGTGAFVLVYYLLPNDFFVVLPKIDVLLIALAAAGGLEVLRLGFGVELPTMRAYEARRPASYLYYAVGLVAAIALFPEPIAVAVILGTALVDPLAGELRSSEGTRRLGPGIAAAVYAVLAAAAFAGVGRWPWAEVVGLAVLGAAVAIPVERWRFRWVDDDLTMTIVPAVALYLVAIVGLRLPV
jgi:dolichol kinase